MKKRGKEFTNFILQIDQSEINHKEQIFEVKQKHKKVLKKNQKKKKKRECE